MEPRFLSFGGGKGGVGKTTVLTSLAVLFSKYGKKVIVMDGDLGGANLHLFFGIKSPKKNLNEFLNGKYSDLKEVVLETSIPNLGLISGASGILKLADPRFSQKQKIIRHLRKLKADYVFVDVGAGSHANVTDFFGLSQKGVIVLTPNPSSFENAYGFLKNLILRKFTILLTGDQKTKKELEIFSDISKSGVLNINQIVDRIREIENKKGLLLKNFLEDFKPNLVINRVRQNQDIETGKRFAEVVRKYLSVPIAYLGYITEEPAIERAIRQLTPFPVMEGAPGVALNCFNVISRNLLNLIEN